MKKLLTIALLLSLGTAHAQTSTTLSKERMRTPVQRAQPTSPPALQVQPDAVAGKTTLPGNILSTEDRSIIVVGGKPVTAGEIKQQLQSELRQASVAASAKVTRTPPQGVPVRDLPGRLGGAISDRVDATRQAPRIGGLAHQRDTITANPTRSYADAMNYCKTHTAEISRVRGIVTPNGRFKIEGICFGDQTGRVEAIGQFPGGNMRLVFESWSDVEISAFVPAVSGAADHTIALTVVRTDGGRSPAAQAQFVAARQQMPVPASYWSPDPDFTAIEVDEGGGNIFTGYIVFGAGSPQRSTPFSLRINPACELDTASWSSRTGHVDAFNGWDTPGPLNVAKVDVLWTPRCVTQTTNYVFASSSQRVCSVEFSLSASANCPMGLAP
jgi:hypothetical protein